MEVKIFDRIIEDTQAEEIDEICLTIDQRIKSRQRIRLSNDEDAALVMPRGKVLRDGQLIQCEQGQVIKIVAAEESLSKASAPTPLIHARLCYHLGNRHVPLEISHNAVFYQHDHVLDDMVRQLGGEVVSVIAPFQPEDGAYGGGSAHGHSHSHTHSHHH